MSNKKTLLIDCSEATFCCDKAQYKEASVSEKLKMLLHLIYCKKCKKYVKNNTKLTKLIEQSDIKTCTEEEKKAWKEKIEQEITNQ
tara:strand:- start:31988 stop:32245 length:258 start_codon:yes stop_codon:yes gene_type:complete